MEPVRSWTGASGGAPTCVVNLPVAPRQGAVGPEDDGTPVLLTTRSMTEANVRCRLEDFAELNCSLFYGFSETA